MIAGIYPLERYKNMPVNTEFAQLHRVFIYLYGQWEDSQDAWYEDALWQNGSTVPCRYRLCGTSEVILRGE